jgi:hypothetical protein
LRWLALVAGIALTVLAFAAVTRIADTREGLIAEVVTLFAGLGGIGLLIYGLAARKDVPPAPALARPPETAARRRSGRDLKLGIGGLALAVVLLSGLSVSGGLLWAALGLALLLPMIAGCVYLCVRFLRSSP